MVITWYGQSCFKIQSGELVMAIDPFSKEVGLTTPRFRADILLITHAHFDHAHSETIGGEPFLISGPGEYEAKGVRIEGISTFHDEVLGVERGMNTAYRVEREGLSLLHLGDFGESALREETLERIGDVDILLIPIGGIFTIGAEHAARMVKQIEPRFVIPMHYKIPGLKIKLESVDAFVKEMGGSRVLPQEKFTVKKKDTDEETKTEVIILKPA